MLEKVALSFLKRMGPVRVHAAVSKLAEPQDFFKLSLRDLQQLTGFTHSQLANMDRPNALISAEKELEDCDKKGIVPLFFQDEAYPRRLRQCPDAPIVLYQKGHAELNARRVIAIVGTRNHTEYGKELVKEFVSDIKESKPLVVSGLAMGIDSLAHEACLKNDLPTVGVLGHGLNEVFPTKNWPIAQKMLENQGALVSEYSLFSTPVRENFPVRNRIIAGLCDAVVVVESKERGGSLITAELGNDYNRDVFAFPGSVKQRHSAGCNALIRQQKAHLITGACDFLSMMGWNNFMPATQKSLFVELNPDERNVLDLLKHHESLFLDELSDKCGLPTSQLMGILLTLQLKGGVLNLGGGKFTAL
jgi:DNA processing protein